MGSNMITQIIGGAIIVIVAFALWPTLNSSTNALWSFFRDSCDDGNGNRFTRAYVGNDLATNSALPSTLVATDYYVNHGVHGGKGYQLVNSSNDCQSVIQAKVDATAADTIPTGADSRFFSGTGATTDVRQTRNIYDEAGNLIGTATGEIYDDVSAGSPTARTTLGAVAVGDDFLVTFTTVDPYVWAVTAPMLKRFGGINNLLLTIIPVVSIAGMIGVGVARLYAMGRGGGGDIGSVISKSLFTMIGLVIAMVLAGPIMDSMVDANTVVISGQYQVNSQFNGILGLLFGMMPIVYIASLVTVVGLQAKAALSGGRGGQM